MIRMVMILWHLHAALKSVPVSTSDSQISSQWQECKSCSEEIIIHVRKLFDTFFDHTNTFHS